MSIPTQLTQVARRAWSTVRLAVRKFLQIDGAEWASAFAFNAFFALFPLMILLVTAASFLVERDRAARGVIAFIEGYVPMSGTMQHYIFDTIAGVISARGQAGAVALLLLVWVTLQAFTTLVCATNRAWNGEPYSWWRLPMKSLALLGITATAVFGAIAASALLNMAEEWLFPAGPQYSWLHALGKLVLPVLAVFVGLSLFYMLAPRRHTPFANVWAGALCAALLLQAAEGLFVVYLTYFATLNAVYGAFGGIMALLLWIYISGGIIIFGACLCAACPSCPGSRS